MSKKYSIPWIKKWANFDWHNLWQGPPWEYPTQHCCKNAREKANLEAFLKVVRRCEGTDGPNGYIMLFGGELFGNFKQHPNYIVSKGGYKSTAAGAYQILYGTWQTVIQPRMYLPDFSPESQDKAAKVLIEYRGSLKDVKAGRIEQAVEKCSWEWASLPPGRYGQPIKTMKEIKQYFKQEGGRISPK